MGTKQSRRPKYNKTNITLKKLPPAPEEFSDIASQYWYELGGMLVKQQALMQIDLPLLRFCCEYYEGCVLEPDLEQKKKYLTSYTNLITRFGATPKARLKEDEKGKKIDEGFDDDENIDEWEDF